MPRGVASAQDGSKPFLDALDPKDPRPWMPAAALKADSHELPTPAELKEANDQLIYDIDSNPRKFSDLYIGDEHYGQRQLIVFIRNVYCHVCQNYVRRLVESVPHEVYFKLPIPTTITLITCGAPNLLAAYQKQTACPFRLYTDHSRKLYNTLGMFLNANPGKEPAYVNGEGVIRTTLDSWAEMGHVRPIKDAFRGGNMFQIGGEFLFEAGKPIWCHRMQHMRDHSEMSTITRILGYEPEPEDGLSGDSTDTPKKKAESSKTGKKR